MAGKEMRFFTNCGISRPPSVLMVLLDAKTGECTVVGRQSGYLIEEADLAFASLWVDHGYAACSALLELPQCDFQRVLRRKPRDSVWIERLRRCELRHHLADHNGTQSGAMRASGAAVHESFSSVVAYVVEASVTDRQPKLHRVTAGFTAIWP
jgi:hypothetical protein